jgi:hypothetical protein
MPRSSENIRFCFLQLCRFKLLFSTLVSRSHNFFELLVLTLNDFEAITIKNKLNLFCILLFKFRVDIIFSQQNT